MIEKMKFLTITGPKEEIDRVAAQYFSQYEIHLENPLAQLAPAQNILPYLEPNPYQNSLALAREYRKILGDFQPKEFRQILPGEAVDFLERIRQRLEKLEKKQGKLEEEEKKIQETMQRIAPFRSLPGDMQKILHLDFVRCHFGRIPREYYANFERFVYDQLDTVFYPCSKDEEYVWGVYFAPKPQMHRVNAVFASMHFERIYLEDVYQGTAENSYQYYAEEQKNIAEKLRKIETGKRELICREAAGIFSAQQQLETLSANFDIRKMAGCIKEKQEDFFVLCGWMAERDAKLLLREIEEDMDIFCVMEDDPEEIRSHPPTKLKNPKIFRPFEMYVRMYGLPDYAEMDPTIFVALTYSFIFGAMFGDVGHGLLLVIGGFLLYHFKKMDLAAIIGTAGFFSVFFGFLFGSFFGFEDILPAIWLRPMTAKTDVPFMAKMNTIFVVTIVFGMFLNLGVMIWHTVRGIRKRDFGEAILGTNAATGVIFYGAATACMLLLLSGKTIPGVAILLILFLVPLVLIGMKEPIENLIEKMPPIEGGAVMFFVQTFFELFEILLSYFSNTLSFVRIGAFAVSHAAMMEVVLMLAEMENGGVNPVVIVLGNLFVCAMEGLIVGIQVLRLEYYELFSRFYKGSGREFHPFRKHTR